MHFWYWSSTILEATAGWYLWRMQMGGTKLRKNGLQASVPDITNTRFTSWWNWKQMSLMISDLPVLRRPTQITMGPCRFIGLKGSCSRTLNLRMFR